MRRQGSGPPELPGFTFVKGLGSGGFSDVYLYQQQRPRRQVAIKVLITEDLTDAAREAFDAEANVMASLSAHSNIVSIYQADISDDGRPYFVMEYYGGPTLAQSYKTEPLGVVETLGVGVRLSGAVATAHAQGILHRDIKPGNVLTNSLGALGLTDFGISSRVDTGGVAGHTTTSWALGGAGSTNGTESHGMSIPWSPPEMFDDDPQPDVRSDLFSLAATMWTLLAGRTPFEKPNEPNYENDLVGRILRGAITPFTRTDVPSSLVAVLRKAMSVDRAHRFADVVQFARALQQIEIDLGYTATPLEAPGLNVPRARVEESDEADRTRARGITSIPAQNPVAPTPSGFAEPDATRARAVPVVAQAPVAIVPPSFAAARAVDDRTVRRATSETAPREAPPESAESAPAAPASRPGRGRLAAVLVALGLVLAVVAIVVSVVLTRPPATGDPDQAVIDEGEDPLLGELVPTPVLVSATPSADGTSVTFVWENPAPQDGDTYLWTRTDPAATDTVPLETEEPTATVEGIPAGTTVCVEIEILRAGQGSAVPLEECAP